MGTVYRETYTKPLPAQAEVFTRKGERFARWTDRAGRKCFGKVLPAPDGTDRVLVEARTYTAKYRDGTGRIRKVSTGCRDRDAALIVLAELERRAERVRCGSLTAAEDAALDHQATPLAEHIAAYLRHLAGKRGKGGKPTVAQKHVANVRRQLRCIIAECGFARLHDLNRDAVERWVQAAVSTGCSARTVNAHLAAIVAFCNWCVAEGRLVVNPLTRLRKLDERADRRHERRALTEDELRRLLTVARLRPLAEYGRPVVKLADAGKRENKRSRRTWKRAALTFDTLASAAARAREVLARRPDFIAELERRGRERALLYKTLVLTGLRKGELASLTVGQLELGGRVAFAVLNAADAKAGRGAEIPLRADLAAEIRAFLADRLAQARAEARAKGLPLPARLPDDAPLFNVPADLVRSFDRDLRVAGIPKRDDRGRVLDVHALRHTFGTHLSKAGVAPRVAQAAMRHSTIELTMNTYTDPRLLDVAGALDALPPLPLDDQPDTQQARATGTDGREAGSCGLPEPVLSEGNARPRSDFLYQKSTAETRNRDSASADCGTYASRNLVPMLVPTSGKTCTQKAQTGTSDDDRLSGGIAGSVTADASCASMSRRVKQRAMGFEPTTSSLGSWHSTTELRPHSLRRGRVGLSRHR